ncbi:MAG: pyrroline-5-carboxylate reductase [Sphingomicrobium sp.]
MSVAFPSPTWLVGCGNMAGAMVEGWRAVGLDCADVIAVRPSGTPVEGVRTVTGLPDGPTPALVMLGFKPQKLDEIAPGLAERLGAATIIISLLAGVEAATLRERFPTARAIVRAMPNLPVAQRKGVIALYSEDGDEMALGLVEGLMRLLGVAPIVNDEAQFSAIGAVAGSGPAYVARFVEALAAAGEGLGLSPDLAASVALETIIGTAAMAEASGVTMAELARQVASPKGTTEAGLAVLDANDGLRGLIERMVEASTRRGNELAEAARRG